MSCAQNLKRIRSLLGGILLSFFWLPVASGQTVIQFNLLYQKNGTAVDDYLGYSVNSAGDVNNDGRVDFVAGAPEYGTNNPSIGHAKVFSGLNGNLLYTIIPPDTPYACEWDGNQWFGSAVAIAGNVDSYSGADIIIGRYYYNYSYGSALVFRGGSDYATGNTIIYNKWATNTCGCASVCRLEGDKFGYSVAGIGDINSDGKSDFIVGAPFDISNGYPISGRVFVYSGATGDTIPNRQKGGNQGYNLFGAAVGGGGDVNGDGTADFIIGAPGEDEGYSDVGAVYVYSGTTGDLISPKKFGAFENDAFGRSVAIIGDLNGDGKAEFIVGTPRTNPGGRNGAGSAYIYSGGSNFPLLYPRIDGPAAGDSLGYSVAGIGDVDGDQIPDFVIGAPGTNSHKGKIYIYSGGSGTLLGTKSGLAFGDDFGYSVSGGGDMTGDGLAEIVVGAPDADPGAIDDAGSVYVYKPVLLAPPRIRAPRPSTFNLDQNYPNPFNANTNISFSLNAPSRVELVVYNILGEKVRTLLSEDRPAGTHEVAFDGRDDKGKPLSSGTYFYKLTAGDKVVTKQMALIK